MKKAGRDLKNIIFSFEMEDEETIEQPNFTVSELENVNKKIARDGTLRKHITRVKFDGDKMAKNIPHLVKNVEKLKISGKPSKCIEEAHHILQEVEVWSHDLFPFLHVNDFVDRISAVDGMTNLCNKLEHYYRFFGYESDNENSDSEPSDRRGFSTLDDENDLVDNSHKQIDKNNLITNHSTHQVDDEEDDIDDYIEMMNETTKKNGENDQLKKGRKETNFEEIQDIFHQEEHDVMDLLEMMDEDGYQNKL
ncbi:hypothetical protein SNEBB_010214 [Seison nebaliae]|nr:hypothetical protein SNEBB_010214 [Seison nebaliae]